MILHFIIHMIACGQSKIFFYEKDIFKITKGGIPHFV
jgi:hypothetical protein